jgi:quercetin dioxygenase-like cupin family protein
VAGLDARLAAWFALWRAKLRGSDRGRRDDEGPDHGEPLCQVNRALLEAVGGIVLASSRCVKGYLGSNEQMTSTIPESTALSLLGLITPTAHGIASRILSKTSGGSLTLFAFDAGQGLAEHTTPFDALVMVLDGRLSLTIGGVEVIATPGTIVRMPAGVPHAVDAPESSRILLVMLRTV